MLTIGSKWRSVALAVLVLAGVLGAVAGWASAVSAQEASGTVVVPPGPIVTAVRATAVPATSGPVSSSSPAPGASATPRAVSTVGPPVREAVAEITPCGSSVDMPCYSITSVVLPAIDEERGAAMFGIVLLFGLFLLVIRRALAVGLGVVMLVFLVLSIVTGQDTWLFAWLVICVMFAIADFLRARLGAV